MNYCDKCGRDYSKAGTEMTQDAGLRRVMIDQLQARVKELEKLGEENEKLHATLRDIFGFDQVWSFKMNIEDDLEWHKEWRLKTKRKAGVAIGRVDPNAEHNNASEDKQ